MISSSIKKIKSLIFGPRIIKENLAFSKKSDEFAEFAEFMTKVLEKHREDYIFPARTTTHYIHEILLWPIHDDDKPFFLFSVRNFRADYFDRLKISTHINNSIFILDLVKTYTGSPPLSPRLPSYNFVCVRVYLEFKSPIMLTDAEAFGREFDGSFTSCEDQFDALEEISKSVCFSSVEENINKDAFVSTLPFSVFTNI
jgi:hypothetical protein